MRVALRLLDRLARPLVRRLTGESPQLARVGLHGYPGPLRAWYWLSAGALFVFFTVFARWDRVGLGNLPPNGGWMFVSNHLSSADPVMTAAAIYPRWPRYMAKIELFQKPIAGFLFAISGAFPVRRAAGDVGALREGQACLKRGEILGMFPEGRRSPGTALIEAHPGTAMLALRSRVPIIPVAITGTQHLRRGWRVFFQRPHIRIVFGEPFRLPEPARIDRAAADAATIVIMREIATQLPERYRGVYRERFADLPPEAAVDLARRPAARSA